MIEISELKKTFRTTEVETMALNIRRLCIESNEFVAVMGPSGCGKSSLLNILGLLDRPTRGSYKLNGQETSWKKEKQLALLRKQFIGFVFQNFNLITELTVYENIELPLLYLPLSAGEMRERIDREMDRMGIAHRRNHYADQLSGGQQQRVAIARAVVTRPSLILADEPTGNLDSRNGREVMELLTELNASGSCVIVATHNNHDASFASRIINLLDGEIVNETLN